MMYRITKMKGLWRVVWGGKIIARDEAGRPLDGGGWRRFGTAKRNLRVINAKERPSHAAA